jgi:hypothetical protein
MAGDAQGISRNGTNDTSAKPWPWTCGWLALVIHKTGNRAAVVADEAVGFACNTWGRPSRAGVVINGLVLGQSYTLQPRLIRNLNGPGDDRMVASEGLYVTIDQLVKIDPGP